MTIAEIRRNLFAFFLHSHILTHSTRHQSFIIYASFCQHLIMPLLQSFSKPFPLLHQHQPEPLENLCLRAKDNLASRYQGNLSLGSDCSALWIGTTWKIAFNFEHWARLVCVHHAIFSETLLLIIQVKHASNNITLQWIGTPFSGELSN